MHNSTQIKADLTEIEQQLEQNPILKAQAIIAAQEWINNNSAAKETKEKSPKAYDRYFKAVMCERAAVILQKDRYI